MIFTIPHLKSWKCIRTNCKVCLEMTNITCFILIMLCKTMSAFFIFYDNLNESNTLMHLFLVSMAANLFFSYLFFFLECLLRVAHDFNSVLSHHDDWVNTKKISDQVEVRKMSKKRDQSDLEGKIIEQRIKNVTFIFQCITSVMIFISAFIKLRQDDSPLAIYYMTEICLSLYNLVLVSRRPNVEFIFFAMNSQSSNFSVYLTLWFIGCGILQSLSVVYTKKEFNKQVLKRNNEMDKELDVDDTTSSQGSSNTNDVSGGQGGNRGDAHSVTSVDNDQ